MKCMKLTSWDFPSGPVVKTSPSNAGGGQGAKIPLTSQPKSQNIKQKQHCNKFNQDLKNGPCALSYHLPCLGLNIDSQGRLETPQGYSKTFVSLGP